MSNLEQMRSVLAVQDLQSSVAFFRDKLGFEIEFEFEGWCFISRDQFRLMLGHCPDERRARETGDHSYFAYVRVSAIDDLNNEFRNRGLSDLEHPENKPWGLREFMVVTPEGHRIMFGQPLSQS